MPFPVACGCGQRFMAQDHLAGKQVPCPACGNQLLIEPPSPQASPAARAPTAAPVPPKARPADTLPGIPVRCVCGKAYKAPAGMRGKSLKCPACGKDIAVPLNAPPPAATAAAAQTAPDPLGGGPLGGDLFGGSDPFAGAPLGNDLLGADLFGGPLAGSPLAGGPLAAPVAGFPAQGAPRPAPVAYGAPQQAADDGGGSTKLLIFLGVGVGVVLLGLLIGIWLINRNDTPVATNTSPAAPATSSSTTTPAPSATAPATSTPPSPAGTAPAGTAPGTGAALPGASPATTANVPPATGANPLGPMPGIAGANPMGPMPGVTGANPMGPMPGLPGATPMGPMPGFPGANPMGPMPGIPGVATPGSSASPSGPARSGSAPGSGSGDKVAASRPSGKALAGGLAPWHASGKIAGVRKVGDAENLQAHYSWMTQVLPFIGHQADFDKINFAKPLTDKDNLQTAGLLIPEFLNPGDDRVRWKGYPFENMALTHFVGMSGIEDARNVVAGKLPRTDPRAGVFGYESIATPAEITDGTSNTIMVLGGGELASPWVMGGGATIRGARQPHFDKITGFGSKGTSGVIVLMADGSVREISSNVDPAVFRAMCTIHGADKFDLNSAAPLSTSK